MRWLFFQGSVHLEVNVYERLANYVLTIRYAFLSPFPSNLHPLTLPFSSPPSHLPLLIFTLPPSPSHLYPPTFPYHIYPLLTSTLPFSSPPSNPSLLISTLPSSLSHLHPPTLPFSSPPSPSHLYPLTIPFSPPPSHHPLLTSILCTPLVTRVLECHELSSFGTTGLPDPYCQVSILMSGRKEW